MEPCFNPALEAQAIGRVHRLGQKRSVDIVRLVMKDSVEVRIRKMLEKKYGSSSKEDNDSDDDDDEDYNPGSKPAATPMVGSIVSDKAAVMEDEFDLLFGVESDASENTTPADSNSDNNTATL